MSVMRLRSLFSEGDSSVEEDRMVSIQLVPRLEGWVTIPEAATILGRSRQAVAAMVFESGKIDAKDIRKLGQRPIYLISIDAVEALRDERDSKLVVEQIERTTDDPSIRVRRGRPTRYGRS